MAAVLLSRFQFVLLIGILLLILVSRNAKEKIRIPKQKFLAYFFVTIILVFVIGNLLFLFRPHDFYFFRTITPLVAGFIFLYNWKIFGFLLMGCGMLLNAFVILVNGCKMPIVQEFFDHRSSIYVPISEHILFPWLGDIFSIEDWYGVYVFSIGDILIYIGGLIAFLYFMYITLLENPLAKEKGG